MKQKNVLLKSKFHQKNEKFLIEELEEKKFKYEKESGTIKIISPFYSLWKVMKDGYYEVEIEKEKKDFVLSIIQNSLQRAILNLFKESGFIAESKEIQKGEVLIIGRRY